MVCQVNRFRPIVLIVVLLCASTIKGHGQWAIRYAEHDWRITIGSQSYGLVQEFFSTYSRVHGTRTTFIYFGSHTFRTRVPASWITAFAALALTLVVVFPYAIRRPQGKS
jgi:hypothetical protein